MDTMRWRHGETNPVVAAVDGETVVEIGDLLFLDAGKAKPAGMLETGEDAAENRKEFALRFLGVAMQRSPKGDAIPVRVATTGVFEFDCDKSAYELGDKTGIAETSGNPENQAVRKVTQGSEAIGRIARREPFPSGTVLIAIVSGVIGNGIR